MTTNEIATAALVEGKNLLEIMSHHPTVEGQFILNAECYPEYLISMVENLQEKLGCEIKIFSCVFDLNSSPAIFCAWLDCSETLRDDNHHHTVEDICGQFDFEAFAWYNTQLESTRISAWRIIPVFATNKLMELEKEWRRASVGKQL